MFAVLRNVLLPAALFMISSVNALAISDNHSQPPSCRFQPGDAGWPSLKAWSKLNETVDGRLVATVPLGSPCHNPNYNAERCQYLTRQWAYAPIHETSPSSPMSAYFQNGTCAPFTPISKPCTLGNEQVYSINISGPGDVQAGLQFAEENDVRLVIKNTGHDYMGRSTGKGALGLWTHNMQKVSVIQDYQSSHYTGPAINIQAGAIASQVYVAADAAGYRAFGGNCPNVGLAGGYTTGGGHGSLAGQYGLAADQVLEWEVVTPLGDHLIATPTQNEDLYWALSGGGGSTFAVVLSMTSRVWKDGPIGGAAITYQSKGLSNDTFWAGFTEWLKFVPSLSASGAGSAYAMLPTEFYLEAVTLPDKSADEMRQLLAPFTSALDRLNIKYAMNATSKPNFLEHYKFYWPVFPKGPYTVGEIMAGKLLSNNAMVNSPEQISRRIRYINEHTSAYCGFVSQDVSITKSRSPVAENAVFPGWRTSSTSALCQNYIDFDSDWATKQKLQAETINVVQPQLDMASPDSGIYLSEANWETPNWQEQFFGSNYPRLLRIKQKYDPHNLLWAITAVGSESLTLDPDGRLCTS